MKPGRRAWRNLVNCIRFCRGLDPIPLEPVVQPLDSDTFGHLKVKLERGIDLPSVRHVVMYDLPRDATGFIQRRTDGARRRRRPRELPRPGARD